MAIESVGEREVVSKVTLPVAEAIRNARIRVKGRGIHGESFKTSLER